MWTDKDVHTDIGRKIMQQINRKSKLIEVYCLLLIDLFCIVGTYMLSLLLRFGTFRNVLLDTLEYGLQLHYNVCVYFMLFCVLYTIMMDWNRHFFSRGSYVEAIAIIKYEITMVAFVAFVLYLTQNAQKLSRLFFAYFAVLNFILTYGAHILFKIFMTHYYKKSNSSDKVMVITDSEYAKDVIKKLNKDKGWNYQITSVAILDKDMEGEQIEGIPVVANRQNLFEVARMAPLDEVFMFLPNTSTRQVKELIRNFELMGVTSHYSVDALDLNMKGRTVGNFAGYAVVTFSLQYVDYRRVIIKRTMDICGGLVGSLITLLLTPFVALAIKIESPGPVFFAQTRIGKNGRRFKILKFRSMYIDAEERKKELMAQNEMQDGLMFKMEDDPRITKVGKFIRKTSIDELPQFFNVFIGDMSLVGTRPPTEDEFEKYKLHYRRRMSITPGLTGMWQVKGRGKVFDFEEVVKLDLEYIDNWTLSLDIKILFQTVYVVLFGVGAK